MLMLLSDWGRYMGYTSRHTLNLYKAGLIIGVTELTEKIKVVDSEKVQIIDNPNRPRRLDGCKFGRAKPRRGEPGFVEKIHAKKLKK